MRILEGMKKRNLKDVCSQEVAMCVSEGQKDRRIDKKKWWRA
jgi:hypothetical protein